MAVIVIKEENRQWKSIWNDTIPVSLAANEEQVTTEQLLEAARNLEEAPQGKERSGTCLGDSMQDVADKSAKLLLHQQALSSTLARSRVQEKTGGSNLARNLLCVMVAVVGILICCGAWAQP